MTGPNDVTPGGSEPGRLPLPPALSPRGRKASGTVLPRPPRRRRIVRYASWVSVTASVLVLVLSGAAFAYYQHLNGNIHRISVFDQISGHRPAEAQDGAENILVVGDDTRVGETAQQLREENTTQDGGGQNTDTIIVMHLAPNNGPATLVSIPRDSYVPIPGHGTFKINSAYADGEADHKGGGPALLTQTVENLSGLHIDHFISVSFGQFIDISNAIGGVKVCVSTSGGAHDHYSGVDLPRGVSTISGSQALAFVRQRHGLPEGDIDRIKRQQRFITAVVQKAKNERNPATINAVLEKVTSSITVDSGLSGIALAKLANRLKNLPPADIRFVTVPTSDINATSSTGVSYVQLDTEKLPTFFANIKAERDPDAQPPSPVSTVTPLSPSDTHVIVRNASGAGGLAAETRTRLERYGFAVDSIGNGSGQSTTIRYNPADAGAAKELALAVPSATVTEDQSVSAGAVVLTLGSSDVTVQDPTAHAPSSSTASPSTSSSSSSSSSVSTAAGTGNEIDGVPCGP
ncbi:MAG: LCP family protein [Mycobacteriales bacterium]